MSTSVATNPTRRGTTSPAVAAVQGQRLPQLVDDVAAGALCAELTPVLAPDSWFQGEGESCTEWVLRAERLREVCAACPVRAACEESALRQREGGTRAGEDMVRGGRTSAELYAARVEQATRLAAAAEEDERVVREERQLHDLAMQLRTLTLTHCDSRSNGSVNARIQEAAAELRVIRRVRRARSGWSAAA